MESNLVKENTSWAGREPLSQRWVILAALITAAAFVLVTHIDRGLPEARHPPPASPATSFSGILAHDHLVNLTSIGPRVAGSYENEVLAVATIVRIVKNIAAKSSPHNHVELDLHRASGAFPLTFFDGMNNIYRDVQSVVVRVRGAGGGAGRGKRSALLLNCHFDTVPDSPGASDDGAGCAVLLEVLRALASTPHPLRHDAIFLFNGAEENIMQASHAFITTHKWAKSVRAFINIEACGAGGREVLFQAGPHDPWIMEVYAGAVPHPFASSLAQELFQSGLIPADTDFRIFRDFGKLSGVDLAWCSNGYVYHTHLDTADTVPPEALQRTGDNVLALTHGLLVSENLESELDTSTRQPVYFDILGVLLVCARAPLATLVALGTLALIALVLHTDAKYASKHLYVSRGAWWRAMWRAGGAVAGAHAAGVAAAGGAGLVLHVAGARLAFYSRPWLLAPLYALPAVGTAWYVVSVWSRRVSCGAVAARGWCAARLWGGALVAAWGALVALCLALRLRSGFVPMHWALMLALATRAAQLTNAQGGGRLVWWCFFAVMPLLQTWYLALGCLQMFVPIMGRAGTPPLPPDVMMGVLTGVVSVSAASWAVPVLGAARGGARVAGAALLAGGVAATIVALAPTSAVYSPQRPQRYMVFHTRRTVHGPGAEGLTHYDDYWMPHFDANTPYSLRDHVPELASAEWVDSTCDMWPYCGAPYYLPVINLISRGYFAPAPSPPLVRLHVTAATETLGPTTQALHINITGPTHIVVVVSPTKGAKASWCSLLNAAPLQAAEWSGRHTYFFTLHDARAHNDGGGTWNITVHLEHQFNTTPDTWASLSIAGHGMADKRAPVHQELLDRFPNWTAYTGWGVHMHLMNV